jgi:hypothetical protein
MEAPPSPFVISTGAQRSGEICGPADLFLGMFFDRTDAKWRDLCVDALSWKCFSTEHRWTCGAT